MVTRGNKYFNNTSKKGSIGANNKNYENEKAEDAAVDHHRGEPGGGQSKLADRRPARAAAAAGLPAFGEAGPSKPGAHSGAHRARQGLGGLRHADDHAGHHAVHEGRRVRPGREEDRVFSAFLDRGGRAGRGGCRAGCARFRPQGLHRRGQLGHGGEQHAGVLHSRSLQIPGFHPYPKAASAHEPAEQHGDVGFLVAEPREPAPGDHPDVGPRPAAELPPYQRLRQPHLQLPQREERAVLGEIPFQDTAGNPVSDQRGSGGDCGEGSRELAAGFV